MKKKLLVSLLAVGVSLGLASCDLTQPTNPEDPTVETPVTPTTASIAVSGQKKRFRCWRYI